MTKKEIIKLAAYEYMTQYWRDNAIYNALKEYDIYFNVEEKLENAYLEQIFHKVSTMFTELLLQCETKKEKGRYTEEKAESTACYLLYRELTKHATKSKN